MFGLTRRIFTTYNTSPCDTFLSRLFIAIGNGRSRLFIVPVVCSLGHALIFPVGDWLLLAGAGWAVYPALAMLVIFTGQILWRILRERLPHG